MIVYKIKDYIADLIGDLIVDFNRKIINAIKL